MTSVKKCIAPISCSNHFKIVSSILMTASVGVPAELEVESVGESWIVFSWSLFPGELLITEQFILVSEGGTDRNITLEGNGTLVNITRRMHNIFGERELVQ